MEEGMTGRGDRPATCGYPRDTISIRNVLVVIGEDSTQAEVTLSTAIELAERVNARLTIARTRVACGAYVWVTPFVAGAAFVDMEAESPEQACRSVAVMARAVPQQIPVTTLVLDQSIQKRLVKLIAEGHFGAIVADERLLSSAKKLRRFLASHEMLTVPVAVTASTSDSPPGVANDGSATAAEGHALTVPAGGYISPGAPLPIR